MYSSGGSDVSCTTKYGGVEKVFNFRKLTATSFIVTIHKTTKHNKNAGQDTYIFWVSVTITYLPSNYSPNVELGYIKFSLNSSTGYTGIILINGNEDGRTIYENHNQSLNTLRNWTYLSFQKTTDDINVNVIDTNLVDY